MEFLRTRSAIRLAERAVIGKTWLWHAGGKPKDGRVVTLIEELLVAPWLVQAGLSVLWGRAAWAAVVALVVACGLWLIEMKFLGETLVVAIAFGTGSVYFGLPSRTVLYGVSPASVGDLTRELIQLSESPDDIGSLASGVQLIKTQSLERLNRFNVFAGILWAAYFWFIGSRLLAPTVTPETIQGSLLPIVFVGAAFFGMMVVAAGYAAAVRIVYLTIEFALLDADRYHDKQRKDAVD